MIRGLILPDQISTIWFAIGKFSGPEDEMAVIIFNPAAGPTGSPREKLRPARRTGAFSCNNVAESG